MWGTISRFPVKNFAVVILIAGAITFAGLSNLDELDKPITGSDQTPDNIPSMEAMVEFQHFLWRTDFSVHIRCFKAHQR